MACLNNINFLGYLTRDVEVKVFSSGKSAYTLSMAATKKFKNKETGEIKEEVCFVDAITWANINVYAPQLKKGNKVLISGYLKFDQWENAEGKKQSKHRIYAEQIIPLDKSNDARPSNLNNPELDYDNIGLPF